jgi:hypothetical protein
VPEPSTIAMSSIIGAALLFSRYLRRKVRRSCRVTG